MPAVWWSTMDSVAMNSSSCGMAYCQGNTSYIWRASRKFLVCRVVKLLLVTVSHQLARCHLSGVTLKQHLRLWIPHSSNRQITHQATSVAGSSTLLPHNWLRCYMAVGHGSQLPCDVAHFIAEANDVSSIWAIEAVVKREAWRIAMRRLRSLLLSSGSIVFALQGRACWHQTFSRILHCGSTAPLHER